MPLPGAVHPRKKKSKRRSTFLQARRAGKKLKDEKAVPADLSAAGKALSARRMTAMSQEERTRVASVGAKAYWASMSEKERKIEMRRRIKIRTRRQLAARQEKIRAGK